MEWWLIVLISAPTWNMSLIGADSAWAYGYDGDSVIIAMITDGVDTTHPALQGKILRYYKIGNPLTYSGTSEAGIMVGGDGTGPFPDDIGVAPGAKLIVVATETSDLLQAFQFISTLKADSGFDIRAVNTSWSFCTSSISFWDEINVWRMLEIFPVFPVGDNEDCGTSPSDSSTVGSPADYPSVMAVGTVARDTCYDSIGLQGPGSINDSIKPDISAPDSNVYSSSQGGGYGYFYGSSLSASHVTGAFASLFYVNPGLSVDSAWMVLVNTTLKPQSCGYSYPNNKVGSGVLNLWSAIKTQLYGVRETETSFFPINFHYQNFDNRIKIFFTLSKKTEISLKLFDISGRRVKNIEKGIFEPGSHKIILETEKLNKGTYFLKLFSPQKTKIIKFSIIK